MRSLRRLAANLFAWSGVMLSGALIRIAFACDEDEAAAIVESFLRAAGLDFIPGPPPSNLENYVRELRAQGKTWAEVVAAARATEPGP